MSAPAASVDSRLLLWQAAIGLWREYPWFGTGANGFFWNYPAHLPIGTTLEPDLTHPHNIWLELATGWGIFGLVWLVGLLALWLMHAALYMVRLSRTLRWWGIGLTSALVAAVAHAQVDAFLSLADLAAWLFVAMGIWAAILARTELGDQSRVS